MPPRFNPFRPATIVGTGMFSGRETELVALERLLYQTKQGNPSHFIIDGERGIGKSSLLHYIQSLARGETESRECGRFKFLTVNVELDAASAYFDILGKIGSEFQRAIDAHHKGRAIARAAWDFLKRWQIGGIRYWDEPESQQPSEFLDALVHAIEQVVAATRNELDGVLILIDEADKPPVIANLGEFVKVFTERLTKRGCDRVVLGLAGLPTLLPKLRQSHESSTRIFDIFTLSPLASEARLDVLRRALAEAQAKNGFAVTMTPEAEKWISELSEGYPHFIQQFAHAAFETDTDNIIDTPDVLYGAFKDHGAFQQLGLKYFEELYFDNIGSDEYREVLRVMAHRLEGWMTKDEIRHESKIKESTLDNAITALKSRGIIVPMPGRRGVYRLPTRSFAVWIRSYTRARSAAPGTN